LRSRMRGRRGAARRDSDRFDYIVVGGGSAGSIVAGRLAQGGGQVLVLEAGGTDRRPEVAVPVGIPVAFKKHNWLYQVEADASRGGAVEKWPAGRVLGGSSSINAGVFVRGHRSDYDGWAAMGADGWGYESVLPAFRRMETWEDGPGQYRGGGGPIGVRRHRVPHVSNEAFIAAAQEAGHPFTPDYNGASLDGVGVSQANQRGHFRSQPAREYLRGVAPAENLEVRTDAVVERVVFEGERAVAVEYREGDTRRTVRARREIVLSAGAVGTPKLLLLSGIGPADELKELGIATVSDLPGVGRNLQDHAGVYLNFKALVPNLNTIGPLGVAKGVGSYLRSSSGFLAATLGQAQVMHRSDPGLEVPDVQLIFANFGIGRRQDRKGDFSVYIPREGSFQVSMLFLRPTPRGRVSLRSAAAADPPRIEYEVFADRSDLRAMAEGAAEACRLMSQPAMRGIADGLVGSGAGIRGRAMWEDWLLENAHGGSHGVGSARMGTDSEAVVGPDLSVHGVGGLRVADASVMPRTTTGNTNAPSMMIGERAAELILGPPAPPEAPRTDAEGVVL
jgi:choline dehydrogenase